MPTAVDGKKKWNSWRLTIGYDIGQTLIQVQFVLPKQRRYTDDAVTFWRAIEWRR